MRWESIQSVTPQHLLCAGTEDLTLKHSDRGALGTRQERALLCTSLLNLSTKPVCILR